MRRDLFRPTEDGEARLLLLIGAFSGPSRVLEGRTKLAKLDFLLRYPQFLQRALNLRRPALGKQVAVPDSADDIEARMVRYRFGPWDPAYFALLGRLVGKGLIAIVPYARGIGFRTTDLGGKIATELAQTDPWKPVAERARLLKRAFDISGSNLTKFVYENFPEVATAAWGDPL